MQYHIRFTNSGPTCRVTLAADVDAGDDGRIVLATFLNETKRLRQSAGYRVSDLAMRHAELRRAVVDLIEDNGTDGWRPNPAWLALAIFFCGEILWPRSRDVNLVQLYEHLYLATMLHTLHRPQPQERCIVLDSLPPPLQLQNATQ